MKKAIDLATSIAGQVVNAVVIVDPSTKQVIASACDQVMSSTSLANDARKEASCSKHPEKLNASALENQQTLLSDGPLSEIKHLTNNVACVQPWRWAVQHSSPSSGCWHPLMHAAILAIEYSASRDRQLFPDYGYNEDGFSKYRLLSPSKKQKIKESVFQSNGHVVSSDGGSGVNVNQSSESIRPYLCTGYDIYLVWEPCAMCAMALVHQRVRRIFYSFPNSNAGALGSVQRLQGERSLNHHYAVFRVLVPEGGIRDNVVDAKTA